MIYSGEDNVMKKYLIGTLTVPADKDDIVLWINRTDCHSDEADSQPIPHIYGDNYDEIKEDCVFIKLSDLVTD